MTERFRVLDAAAPDEYAEWCALLDRSPDREVSAHPAYARLFCREGDRVLAAVQESGDGGVLFPLILRPIAREAWAAGRDAGCDLTTPYGYGGPFAWGGADADRFWDGFDAWAAGQRAVALFVRLSLFPEQLLPFRGEVERKGWNVVRSLAGSVGEIWKEYEQKVRKNVNRATREGLRVEIDRDGERLAAFRRVYEATMDRRAAGEGYYFSDPFFEGLTCDLAGRYVFFHALRGEEIVSSEIVLVSARHIYSFLGGTLAEAFDLRPNDLLKHRIVEWGIEEGKEAFVLGGGVGGGEDGIFRYKKSLAPRGIVPFMVARRILDAGAYESLIEMRRAHAAGCGEAWTPASGYFPLYRS